MSRTPSTSLVPGARLRTVLDMADDHHLGHFLRARRALVSPSAAGVATSGRRRVRGLRREEVAVLADVNVDYYARLEQGRETHPSAQVLDALARAYDLDDDARRHMFLLAGLAPGSRRASPGRAVSPDLLHLLDLWPATPAIVLSRRLDVLAANPLARALHSGFSRRDNLLAMLFLDPAGRTYYRDWDRAAQTSVANLRAAAGHDPDDPQLHELVAHLSSGSAEFRQLWQQQHVRGKTRDPKTFHHPDVGTLVLLTQTFDVPSAPGQQLVVYSAEPSSQSAQALSLLGTLAATTTSDRDWPRDAASAT